MQTRHVPSADCAEARARGVCWRAAGSVARPPVTDPATDTAGAGVMFAGEESMFGHVGDQLNGLESRMANFEFDPPHSSLPLDHGQMMNGGILPVGESSNASLGGVGVGDAMPGGGSSGTQNGTGAAHDMAIKVLVSNKDAGSLIGKNGSTIVSFQAATGSRVRVSRADEPFPGTQERVVLITGSLECVSRCLALVIEQVHKHFADYPYADKEVQPLDPNAHRTMNLVVPAGASGLIIGRGGDTVRTLASKSGVSRNALCLSLQTARLRDCFHARCLCARRREVTEATPNSCVTVWRHVWHVWLWRWRWQVPTSN